MDGVADELFLAAARALKGHQRRVLQKKRGGGHSVAEARDW